MSLVHEHAKDETLYRPSGTGFVFSPFDRMICSSARPTIFHKPGCVGCGATRSLVAYASRSPILVFVTGSGMSGGDCKDVIVRYRWHHTRTGMDTHENDDLVCTVTHWTENSLKTCGHGPVGPVHARIRYNVVP